MFGRLAASWVVLCSTHALASEYAVAWERSTDEVTAERRVLIEQAQRRFRDELRRRGVTVLERGRSSNLIVLTPRLEVVPGGLTLKLVGVREKDRSLVGSVTMRAKGSNRTAVLNALVTRACDEAIQL